MHWILTMSSLSYFNRSDGQIELLVSQSVKDGMVENLYVYGAEGFILAIVNFPVLFTILFYTILRSQKEFIIVSGLSLVNGCHGLALILASIGRVSLITSGNGFVLKSRWHCLITPWNLMFMFTYPLIAIMLLVISIDRLLAVMIPFKYYKFTSRYALFLVIGAYSTVIPMAVVCTVLAYRYQVPENPAYCFIEMGCDDQYIDFIYTLRIGTCCTSVLLYIPIIFLLRQSTKANLGTGESTQQKRLKKVTLTLAVSTCSSIFFFVTTDVIIRLTASSLLLFSLNNVHAILNIFIYTLRFKEIRSCLKAMILGCRKVVNAPPAIVTPTRPIRKQFLT